MVGGQRTEAAALAVGVLAGVWRWRLELALLALATGAERLLAGPLGDPAATVVVVARAAIDVGLADGPLRCPRVLRAMRVPAGDVLRVRVRRGQSVMALDARAAELAACLRVREVRVEGDRADAAIARPARCW